jgi:ABC-2 type transport system permease protein
MSFTVVNDTYWVFWREMKRFRGQRVRILFTITQPILWLALMGNMYQRVAAVPGFPAQSYLDYMAPGVVVMTALFGGVFGGTSISWDRRLGYLEKMLAAPISRSAIVLGKTLAVAVQSGLQALLIFALALIMGVHFRAGPLGIAPLLLLTALITTVFSGLSLAIAAVVKSQEAIFAIINFLTLPVMFTSSAMMPLEFMPSWLAAVSRFNPISYAVQPMRALFLTGWTWDTLTQGTVSLGVASFAMVAIATSLFRRSVA